MVSFVRNTPNNNPLNPYEETTVFSGLRISANFALEKTDDQLYEPLETYGPLPDVTPHIDKSKEVVKTGNKIDNTWDETIFDIGKQFIGWGAFVATIVKGNGQLNITKVYSTFLNIASTLKAFDWNKTDEQLKQAIESQNTALASVWGGAFGKGVAGLVGCSVAAGAAMNMPRIGGGALARRVVDVVKEEATDEFIGDFKAALNFTSQKAVAATSIKGYMKLRHAIKSLPEAVLSKFFSPEQVNFIKNEWGTGKGGQITFNDFMDETIEKIESPELQAFAEEFIDELWDGLVDYGYIIAQELDSAYEQARLEQFERQGQNTIVTITPNIDAPDETFTYIDQPRGEIIQLVQSDLRQYNQWQGHSVGQIVASSYQENVATRPMLRKLVVEFSSRPAPPWIESNNKPAKVVTIDIPDVKSGLLWKEIKKAAKFYTWGPFRATGIMNNRRQMVVYGQSKQEATDKLKELAELSTATIIRLSCTEEVDVPLKLKKEPVMVYPKSARLLFRKNSLDGEGKIYIDNQYFDTEYIEYILWTDDEPPGTQPLP